jgi:hypothetical protein
LKSLAINFFFCQSSFLICWSLKTIKWINSNELFSVANLLCLSQLSRVFVTAWKR